MGTFDDTLKSWELAVRSSNASQLALALKSLRSWANAEGASPSATTRHRALVEALIGSGFARAASHDRKRFTVAVGVFQRAVQTAMAAGGDPVDRPELWAAASRLVARTSVTHSDMPSQVVPLLQAMAAAVPFQAIREILSLEITNLSPKGPATPAPPPAAAPDTASADSAHQDSSASSFSNARLRPVTDPEVATWSDPGDVTEPGAPPAPLHLEPPDLDPNDLEPDLLPAPIRSAPQVQPPSQRPAPAATATGGTSPTAADETTATDEPQKGNSFSNWDGDLGFVDPPPASPTRWDESDDDMAVNEPQLRPPTHLEDSAEIDQPEPQVTNLAPSEVIAPADAALATIFTKLREARAALTRRQRDGDAGALEEAAGLATEVLGLDPDDTATAAAHAVRCEVAMERGDSQEADAELEQALQADPECEDALDVALRLRSGGSETSPFLATLRFTIAQGKEALLDGVEQDTLTTLSHGSSQADDDPRPLLLGTYMALDELEDVDQADELAERAWQMFPPRRSPHLSFGADLNYKVARALLTRGQQLAKAAGEEGRLDMARLGETKTHLPGGYVQMALGIARLTLYSSPDLSASQRADLGTVAADGLFALQFYDAAKAEFQRVVSLDRSRLGQAAGAAAEQCHAMKLRAVDDSSIVVRAGRWIDPLSEATRKSTKDRANQLRDAARDADVEASRITLSLAKGLCQQSTDIPGLTSHLPELQETIKEVRDLEAQLQDLHKEQDQPAEDSPEESPQPSGLLGRVSAGLGAAASKARNLAQKAQLSVRIQTTEGRYNRLLNQAGRQFYEGMRSGKLSEVSLPEGVFAAVQRVAGLQALVSRCKAAAEQLAASEQQLRDVLEPRM